MSDSATSAPVAGTGAFGTLLSRTQEEFQTITIDGGRIILSVRDSEVLGDAGGLGDDFSTDGALFVFAEQLTVAGPTKLPRRAAVSKGTPDSQPAPTIVAAHRIEFVAANGSGASLIASGQDGQAPIGANFGATAAEPYNGAPGSHVLLYAESIAPASPFPAIEARGGAGSAGQPGTSATPGGDGGDGGRGGSVSAVVVHPYPQLIPRLQAAFAEADLDAQLAALRAIRQEFADVAVLASLDPVLQHAATKDSVAAAISSALAATYIAVAELKRADTVDVDGGRFGELGTGRPSGHDGISGKHGTAGAHPVASTADLPQLPPESFFLWAHPSQCGMLLERARLLYLMLDDASPTLQQDLSDLTVLLQRLRDRTAPLASLDAKHPLAVAIRAFEPAVGAAGTLGTLRNVHDQAVTYLDQLKAGVDIFGRDAHFTPSVSYDTMKTVIDQAIDTFAVVEKNYNDYYDALAKNTAALADFTAARSGAESAVNDGHRQLADLVAQAQETAARIDGLQQRFPAKKAALLKVFKDVERDVAYYFAGPRTSDLFGALGSLAFAPESELNWVSQAGSLIDSSANTVVDDQGQKVQKSYIIHTLRAVESTVDGILEGSKQLSNGTLAVDDPAAGKLVAQEDKVMSMLDGLSGALPDDYKELKAAFDDYVQVVLERNTAIVQYNAQVTSMQQLSGEIAQIEDRISQLNDAVVSSMQGDWPELTAFASRVYYSSRTTVLRLLDLFARAYRFWALADNTTMATLLGGGKLPRLGASELTDAKVTMLEDYVTAREAFNNGPGDFPATDDEAGIIVPLSPTQLSTLIEPNGDGDYEVMVRVPVAGASSQITDNPFAGKRNVRITKVRFRLGDGAVTAAPNMKISIAITHTGREQIVSQGDDVFAFSHKPRTVTFTYQPGKEGAADGDDFGDPASDEHSPYALYGPFTLWHIQIPRAWNSAKVDGETRNLDLSKVTGAFLEFHGKFHPPNNV